MKIDLTSIPSLPTPSLIVDLDALDANIAALAAYGRAKTVALRPHAKTHKSSTIALLQVKAGAIGVSAATIAEARGLACAGVNGILITTPLAGSWKLAALRDLVGSGADIICVAETAEGVKLLGEAVAGIGRRLPVLVDFDVGHGRSGAGTGAQCVEIARTIAAFPQLEYAGMQAYAGNVQHIVDSADRVDAQRIVNAKVRDAVSLLVASGFRPPIVSGGGTGSVFLDTTENVFTEIQAGSYVFMDEEYLSLERDPDELRFAPSLYVLATVIAKADRDWLTVDAGTKALASGFAPAKPILDRDGARYRAMGDEHGAIDGLLDDVAATALGSRLLIRPAHCDPTVNLHGVLYGVRRGVGLAEQISVDLRA